MKDIKMIRFSNRIFFPPFFFALFLFTFGSCRQTIDLRSPDSYAALSKPGEINYPAVFESFWTGMNVNYVFWEIDPTNWDDIWDTYKPRFDALGTKPDGDTDSAQLAYNYFVDMTENIVDGHYMITFSDQFTDKITGRPWYINPVREHLKRRYGWDSREYRMNAVNWQESDADVPPGKNAYDTNYNLFKNVTLPQYIDPAPSALWGSWRKADSYVEDLRAATGHIPTSNGKYILYFFFSQFSLSEFEREYENKSPSTLNSEADDLYNALDQFFADLKDPNAAGIILDLRSNNGGSIVDIGYIIGRFINESFIVDYTKFKSGDGRLDYTPWVPERIIPAPSDLRMDGIGAKPIVLLVNRFSASCAETFTMAIKYLPNGYVIGENTSGMTSSPQDAKNRNGGSFTSGPFYTEVMTASTVTKAWDGKIYEDIGVPPDAIISGDLDALFANPSANARDNRLEHAILRIDGRHVFP
jgi:hypothetical protein